MLFFSLFFHSAVVEPKKCKEFVCFFVGQQFITYICLYYGHIIYYTYSGWKHGRYDNARHSYS